MFLFFFFIVTYGHNIPRPGHFMHDHEMDRSTFGKPGGFLPNTHNNIPRPGHFMHDHETFGKPGGFLPNTHNCLPGEKFDYQKRQCVIVSCASPRACPGNKKCETFVDSSNCFRPPCRKFVCTEIPTCPYGEQLNSFTNKCQPITCGSSNACSKKLLCKPADIFCVVGPCPQFECVEPCPLGEELDSFAGVCQPITCESSNACPQDLLCEPVNLNCIVSPCPQFECAKPLMQPDLMPIECPLYLPEPFSFCTSSGQECEYDILTCCSETPQEKTYAISSAVCLDNSWHTTYVEIFCPSNCGEKTSLVSIECPLNLPEPWSSCMAVDLQCEYGTLVCCSGTSQEEIYATSFAKCSGFDNMWHISMPYILCPEDCGEVFEAISIIPIAEKHFLTTDNGVQLHPINEGSGLTPKINDIVFVKYIGYKEKGKEFINTYNMDEPTEIKVSEAPIKGIKEALQLMHEGGKYELTIPSALAYGDGDLQFICELLEVWSETSSGLRYRVIKSGTGRKVVLDDVILGRYKGFTINNQAEHQEFISSEDISKVHDWITGMQEALLLMKGGGIYQIVLPYELAYGQEGNSELGIASYEDLWFNFELLKINPEEKDINP